jgi:aryl-alcohol dehydrogenase-like predicted oxidoreductase
MASQSRSARSSASTGFNPAVQRATPEGTTQFKRRYADRFADGFYRPFEGFDVSSIGIGVHAGESTETDDAAYEGAVCAAVAAGVNLVDTAINDRHQRSERALGAAIQRLLSDAAVGREQLVVCSKGGYIPLDGSPPLTREAYRAYLEREFLATEVLRQEEIVAGGHSLAPRFLRFCIAKSRQNLGLRTIDVYYLHDPELHLATADRETVMARIRAAFVVLEEAASRGDIGVYGCSSWSGFRSAPDTNGHLSLETLVAMAREIAGEGHHFRAIQVPVSLAMPDAARHHTQRIQGESRTLLEAASELQIALTGIAPLVHGRLSHDLPAELRGLFPHCTTDAACAIEFARSLPWISSVVVGMRQEAHLQANLAPCQRRRE